MTKDELITWAKSNGWTEDRFGHLQKAQRDQPVSLEAQFHRRSLRGQDQRGLVAPSQRVLQKPHHNCRRETRRHDPIEREKTNENFHHR